MGYRPTDRQQATWRAAAERVFDQIILDLEDRRGLGDEYSQMDDDIKLELRLAWVDMIAGEIAAAAQQASPY